MAKTIPATAKQVREFFKVHTDLIPEGDASLGATARGRLSPAAREVFNEKSGQTYAEGNRSEVTVTLVVPRVDAKGRKRNLKVAVPVSGARALAGDVAGKAGRLSAKALEAAAEAYAESL